MKTKFNLVEKMICILLCIALSMPYISYTVFAASDTIYVGGVELSNGQYLANGSTTPTTTKPSGGYARWVKNSNETTLYLNNYKYERTR